MDENEWKCFFRVEKYLLSHCGIVVGSYMYPAVSSFIQVRLKLFVPLARDSFSLQVISTVPFKYLEFSFGVCTMNSEVVIAVVQTVILNI